MSLRDPRRATVAVMRKNPQNPIPAPASALPRPAGLRQQVVKGGAFMMARQLVMMAMSIIGMLIVTRVLGPAHYGPYAAALGIYLFLMTLGQMGVEVYLIRTAEALEPRLYHAASTLLLGIALACVIGIELAAHFLGGWVGVGGFAPMLRVLILVLPFQALAVAASAQLEKALDFRKLAIIDPAAQIIYYAVVLPLVLLTHAGPWALVAGWFGQQVSACVAYHIAADYLPRLVWDRKAFRRILDYTAGYSAASWIYQCRVLVNPLIVGHFLGGDSVGIVGIGIKIVDMLSIFKTIAWRLSVAALSRVQHSNVKLVAAITEGMQLQMLAMAPVLLGFSWFGGQLLPHVFGPRWLPVMTIYPFLALSYLTNAQFNVHSSVLYVRRRNWDVAIFHIVHVGLFAVVSGFAVRRLGLVGYGWGEVAGIGGYAVLHQLVAREVGSPAYRLSALWWVAVVIGLFWQVLGTWAIAVPFAAILLPPSIRQLNQYRTMILGKPGATV
jgi:O-antigen/teichoic acid export membrane protein